MRRIGYHYHDRYLVQVLVCERLLSEAEKFGSIKSMAKRSRLGVKMRLRFLLVLLLTIIVGVPTILGAGPLGMALSQEVRVVLNGHEIEFPDQKALIIQGRTLVPIRFIVEALGATIEWVDASSTAIIRSKGKEILLRMGSRLVTCDGNLVEIDVPAQIIGGRTLVPLRFVSEILGAQVEWDEQSRSVLISSDWQEEPASVVPEPAVLEPSEVFMKVSPAVVLVETLDNNDQLKGIGSGFIISSSGTIVTNYHVIEGAHSIRVITSDGGVHSVTSLSTYDIYRDIAVLMVDAQELPVIEWGDSSQIRNGDKILTIGNPLGLTNTISEGLISSASRVIDGQRYIQISAPISQGSSGGVLVDYSGRVIGVTTASFLAGQSLNLAIPINDARDIVTRGDNKGATEPAPFPVESVKLDRSIVDLVVGSSTRLIVTVSPTYASNATVKWTSSNTGIVSVDATGLLTASTAGTAVITVTTVDGGKQDICTVIVRARSTSQDGPINATPHGNTTGNIGNMGIMVQNGEWVYTNTLDRARKIYKMRTGTEWIVVSYDSASYLNVVDDWVYYQNAADNYSIYKVRTDGTKRTKLNDDISYDINVVGSWIYYSNRSDEHRVYKIRIDGTERTKMNSERSVNVVAVEGWVYYSSSGLVKMRTNGTDRTVVTADACWHINVIGDWIYYQGTLNGNRIYKIKTDGTGRTALNKDSSYFINVSGDWVYYQNGSDENSLYRMLTDGTERTQLTTDQVFFINVAGDWVFYRQGSLNGPFYQIRKEGTGRQPLQSIQ